ncbi:hypothetical protein OP10G_0967 [Fimbriimonas ginsengisoli Gsoil 348]|uniref:Uncharacterized protein n=1 Tax=Fimbriimonas ginsengisoli Gsoil 348 TaxID=661478 RepID=A0A068NNJ9_FIMGI|nr:hypothetical protein OP10G_0967 [Fimbriimonas ginsengisoli Gsoil 348]
MWLGLYLGQPGAPLPGAVAILSLFLVSGALLALYQDDLRFDSIEQSIEHVRGLPGLSVHRSIPFSSVSQISVHVAPVLRSDHETSVVHRHWCSVNLVAGEELLRLWEAETDDTEEARLALLERGKAYASRFNRILSVPVVTKE